ncbi:MAG: rhomboid family intramembrane serine protease [Bacteroidota bacterium]
MDIGIQQITFILILANLAMTYKGEEDPSFKRKYLFQVDAILVGKEWIRMISSGFLHSGWIHFLFNMFCLYSFGPAFTGMSVPYFLLIYFGSLIGGNALALFIHRNHGNYSALGASGAVSGIIFAAIVLDPFRSLYFFFIPIIAWLAGLLFVAYSIYGIRSQRDNIGHEAHLGGAIVGLLLFLLYAPGFITKYPWVIAGMTIPVFIFLYLIITRPEMLLIPGYWKKEASKVKNNLEIKRGGKAKTSTSKFKNVEEEINYYLDKGYENLSLKEKKRLEQLSRKTDE